MVSLGVIYKSEARTVVRHASVAVPVREVMALG